MASLTPTIDVSVPTRSTRTYKRKKSRQQHQPMKRTVHPHDFPPIFQPYPQRYTSASAPIQVAVYGTIQKEKATLWAVRFADNFPQPIIKCLNSTGVGCVGFLRRGTLLKYPQTLSLIGQNFVLVCVRVRCFFSRPVTILFFRNLITVITRVQCAVIVCDSCEMRT